METRLKDLGLITRREREALGIRTQPALAAAARISPRKVSDVERGVKAGRKTYEAIERALGFPLGSMQAYLDGGLEPAPDLRGQADATTDQRWTPVLTDEQITAMDSHGLAEHYIRTEREYGTEAADDWLFRALVVRRDARRVARTLASDGS